MPCWELDPDVWFDDSLAAFAIYLCDMCPAAQGCRELGEREECGVWGGTTPEMRGYGRMDSGRRDRENKVRWQLAERDIIVARHEARRSIRETAKIVGVSATKVRDTMVKVQPVLDQIPGRLIPAA